MKLRKWLMNKKLSELKKPQVEPWLVVVLSSTHWHIQTAKRHRALYKYDDECWLYSTHWYDTFRPGHNNDRLVKGQCTFTNNRIRSDFHCLYIRFTVARWLGLLSVLGRWFCCFDFLFTVTPNVGACGCSVFCCALLCVRSGVAVILMGKREVVALLGLSSWCLVMVGWLFLAVS